MKARIGGSVLFLSAALCLLLMGKASFALTAQDIVNIMNACNKAGCGMTCMSIAETTVCFCSECKSAAAAEAGEIGDVDTVDGSLATAGTLYQLGKDQYLCAASSDGRQQCVSFPHQLKVLDAQNLPTVGNDKAAADEIFRMKAMNLPVRTDVLAPVENPTPAQQQPTKSMFPIFRRTSPVGR